MAKSENIKFEISQSNLKKLLDKIKDLAKIHEKKIVVMKFEKDSLILFSFVGKTFKNIYAFKNYIFKYDEIFSFITDIPEPVSYIAKNGIKLYHTINQFLEYDSVSCEISVSNTAPGFADSWRIHHEDIFDTTLIAGDNLIVGKDINMDDINRLMDTSTALFNFNLSNANYEKIKKMSTIDVKENDILTITVEKNKLYMGEKWRLKISDNIEQPDYTYTFPKRYFNTISTTTDIEIFVFEQYILTKYDDYNLMIVLETSV
jgi:hypothetical protein